MMKHWWARIVLGSTSVNAPADCDDRPDAAFEARWRGQMKARLLAILGVLAVWVAGIEARLVYLQVVSHQQWEAAAARQSEKAYPITPLAARGDITDRNGELLAYSVEGYSLRADPSEATDVAREVEEICAALRDCSAAMRADFREKLGRKAPQVVLRDAAGLSPAAVDAIEQFIAARPTKAPAVFSLRRSTTAGPSLLGHPSRVSDVAREVEAICAVLGDCTEDTRVDFRERLTRKAVHVVLRDARTLPPAAAARIDALIAARKQEARDEKNKEARRAVVVWLQAESVRFYPKGSLASHVIGFAGADGNGGGLERKFNKQLAGEKGLAIVEVDRAGREIRRQIEREPIPGATAELTIDLGLQHICERELAAGVREFQAAGGVIIMMDPFTGGILADCSAPTFNPNAFWDADADTLRDRAILDTYEPGSTFKIVTAAAALNEGIWSASDLIDTNPGYITIPGRGRPITEAQGHKYGVLSFERALVKSSNVGAIKIGQRVGPELLAQYVKRFGLGQRLGSDFAGQEPGRVPSSSGRMSDSTLASLSMGYEIAVTPLQMVTAASIVANGGQLVEPRLINAWIRNGTREEVPPRVLKRVIRPETAATLTTIMEAVVEPGGTATLAALQNYRVAGKTGTAKKVVNRRYSETETNVSFVSFLPSRQPRLTILVVIDTPRKGPIYGGTIAAPIFRRVAEAAMVHLGVAPSVNPLPPVVVPANRRALSSTASRSASIIPTLTRVGTRPVMPDVRGMSLRDALRVTQALGLSMSVAGDGVVVGQSPAAGEFVDPGDAGTLLLQRVPAVGRSDR